MSLFETGVIPSINAHLDKLALERRDYGEYWPASSAGYCMRKVIFDRLQVPYVKEDARKQRVFEVGHVFHEWAQRITREAGLSIAQELELQDGSLKIRGHIDDLVLIDNHLILYDYKTQHSRAFSWQKDRPISQYHKMQLGTYMLLLRRREKALETEDLFPITEARILKISKDDLRLAEQQLLWSDELEKEVLAYWNTLNAFWEAKKMPECTCHEQEGGFMSKEAYNPYFYNGKPCSMEWYKLWKEGNESKTPVHETHKAGNK